MKKKLLLVSICIFFAFGGVFAQNEHWSRQFPQPASSSEMLSTTGMSDGIGSPTVARVKWHDGKLWFSGNWEAELNTYWNLWTWSPVDGWEPVVRWHTSQGGVGPMGVINDFLWLPDGRLVVGGEFTRIDNPGGNRYREVQAMAIYDKDEPTADKWQPLGEFQYNGTVSAGGSIYSLAYDSQGNDLYIVGTFAGIGVNNQIHKYNLDTQSYQPLKGGVYKPSNPKRVDAIYIDENTTPSTIYIGGTFKWVGGDSDEPASGGTSIYSYSVASYQEGRSGVDGQGNTVADFGWKSYGTDLQVAGGFINTSMRVLDLLVDNNGDLWIAGGFSHATNTDIKGIAKWDPTANSGAGDWIDPTGKQGVGREVFSMQQSSNGKIYFAGAFGGRSGASSFFPGFNDGTDAHMAMSYDPATDTWAELGNGLYGNVMPECHLTTNGNDVYFTGDFEFFDATDAGSTDDFSSHYIARWNETLDFTNAPIISGTKTTTTLTINVDGGTGTWTYALDGGTAQSDNVFTNMTTGLHYVDVTNGTYTDRIYADFKEAPAQEVAIGGDENIHWSRKFKDPIAYNGGVMDATTGMKGTLTRNTDLEWHNGELYFTGNIEIVGEGRWFVWKYNPTTGYEAIADNSTFTSPPEGMAWHNDLLYVWGSLGTSWKSIAVYDPSTTTWSTFTGTYNGNAVIGTGTTDGSSGIVNDLTWDSDGNMYFVGSWAFDNTIFPADRAPAVKVDATTGEYTPLGSFISPYEPGHPKGFFTILLDETQTPMDIYVGGTFKYARGGTQVENEFYNVAKWNYTDSDWDKMGSNADAQAGLPPISFIGFFMNGGDAKVTDLAIDTNGDVYASGSIAIYDNNPIIADRDEHFGLVKYDASENKWVGASNAGGVTRDIAQMTWLDNNTLLMSGSFYHAEDFQFLGNVAKLNTTTGELTSLGGGLRREAMDGTVGYEVQHEVHGDEIYFFGLFDHAGVNANSNLEAPNSSSYIAMWDGTQSLDPNENLKTEREINVCVSSPYSSENVEVTFSASGAGTGTYHWFDTNGSNEYQEVGTGATYVETIYAGAGDVETRYVVVEKDGVMGGMLSVNVNFIYDDDFNAMTPVISYNESTHELTCDMVGLGYEWYLNGTLITDATARTIVATANGDYTVKVVSHSCTTNESEAITVNNVAANEAPTANAGDNQIVNEAVLVTLDGSASSDPDAGDVLTYLWTAPTGITLSDATVVSPTFTAPDVDAATDYTFTLVVNDGTINSNSDDVVITVNNVVNINENNIEEIAIYPNPTSGVFTINTIGSYNVAITDISGKIVKQSSVNNSVNIDLSNEAKGIYLIKFSNENTVETSKIILK